MNKVEIHIPYSNDNKNVFLCGGYGLIVNVGHPVQGIGIKIDNGKNIQTGFSVFDRTDIPKPQSITVLAKETETSYIIPYEDKYSRIGISTFTIDKQNNQVYWNKDKAELKYDTLLTFL